VGTVERRSRRGRLGGVVGPGREARRSTTGSRWPAADVPDELVAIIDAFVGADPAW